MIKYLLLLLPFFCQGQTLLNVEAYRGQYANAFPSLIKQSVPTLSEISPGGIQLVSDTSYFNWLEGKAGEITSYTATQTGSGHAEIYWPEGATHAVIFLPGAGERTAPLQLYNHYSPINWAKDAANKPKYAIVAFSPGAYSFVSVNNASFLKLIKFLKWLKTIHPEWKSFSATGLSYGAADWYNYIKYAPQADYIAPYSAVLLSITSESLCPDKTKLCGNDDRWKDIKLWAMDGRNDSHHDKQYRYTKAIIDAGYPAKWESIPNTGHCCWNVQYGRADVKEWLSGPVASEPPLTVNAGPDTTILFPVDSLRIKPTGIPVGAHVAYQIIEGGGTMEGSLLKNIYKTKTVVRVYAFLNGQQTYDDITINAIYDPEAIFRRFKLGELNMVILNDGRIMQEF